MRKTHLIGFWLCFFLSRPRDQIFVLLLYMCVHVLWYAIPYITQCWIYCYSTACVVSYRAVWSCVVSQTSAVRRAGASFQLRKHTTMSRVRDVYVNMPMPVQLARAYVCMRLGTHACMHSRMQAYACAVVTATWLCSRCQELNTSLFRAGIRFKDTVGYTMLCYTVILRYRWCCAKLHWA